MSSCKALDGARRTELPGKPMGKAMGKGEFYEFFLFFREDCIGPETANIFYIHICFLMFLKYLRGIVLFRAHLKKNNARFSVDKLGLNLEVTFHEFSSFDHLGWGRLASSDVSH